MSNKKVILGKKRMLWKRVMASVLTAALVLSGSITMQTDSTKVYAVDEAEALRKNSIVNWDGLPEITEQKVKTEAKSGVDIEFTHPGIFTNKENLDLMRDMIHEGYDPWFTAFEAFREDALASKDYENTNADRTHTYIGNADRQDANAAYMQSVMWWVTGDKDYYDNAIDIIRSYSESYDADKFATEQDGGRGWSADIITTGMVMNKLTFAAEILRYATTEQAYDNAWTDKDTENFAKVLEMAYPLYDRTDKWMNQTAFTFQAMIASAVFQNDPDMYELVIERATVNDKAAYHFADASIKWQARLVETTANKEDLRNGKLTLEEVDEPIIQWAEMGRDQPHALAGLSIMSGIVQTSYIQGTEVNENGQIVTDGSGTNLFEFLDHRFLKGANYYYQFNLGYDVPWYPLAKGNESNYANCGTLIAGADNTPGWWTDPSNSGRFTLGGSGVLYYHYLYNEKLSKDDPNFKYIVEAQGLQDDTGGGGDAITNASLLLAPAAAKTGEPQGPPQKKEAAGYAANTAGSGRIQAMDHSGAYAGRMPVTSTPSTEYYTDDLGTREVTNNNYKDDYIWFKDMDMGDAPLNTFMLTSASNSGQGTLFKVVLLDNVNVADWSAVTRAEIDSGEVVAEGYSGGTGWWSTYKTKLFPMTKSLSGKHSFAFLYLGSDNVYDLAANVDWMAFGNSYAYESNTVKDAPVKGAVTVAGDSAVLKNGSYFGWNAINMDVGNSGLTMDIVSEGVGKLHLYSGTPDGEHTLVATYDVPYTGGAQMTVNVPGEHFDTIKGNQDIYYVYEGDTDLTITSICSYYHKDNSIPTVQGEDFALVNAGTVTEKTEGNISYAEIKNGSVALYRLNLSGDNISFRVRTNGKALLTLTSGMDNNGNINSEDVYRQFGILKMEIPNTNGEWASFQCDLTEVTNRASNVYLMVTGADVDIDYIASVGDNTPAEIRSYVYDKPVFSLEKDGAYTDYLLAGQDYKVTVDTFDFDNDTISTMVVLDKNYECENGSIPMNIAQAGEYEALVVADDGNSWTLQTRKLVVAETVDQLIEKAGAYDTSKRYNSLTMNAYQEALAQAKALANGGYTAELVAALQKVGNAVANLIMIIPSKADGEVDYLTYADYLKLSRYNSGSGGYSDVQETVKNEAYNLLDNKADTYIEYRHSQNNTAAYFMIDFTEGMGVKLDKFALQTRTSFAVRTEGVLLEASNDGENWVTISEAGAAKVENLQMIYIKPEYAEVPFRYIRLFNPRVTASGANSFLSIAEFHIYGKVVEQEPLVSFKLDEIKFEKKDGTNIFAADMSETLFAQSQKIPVFTMLGEAKLYQGDTELTSGVTPIVFEGTDTGKGAKRTATLIAKDKGEEQEYVIELTFNTVALKGAKALGWDGRNVNFSASSSEENAVAYELALYKDGELVDDSTVTIAKNSTGKYSHYYGSLIQESGDYTVEVVTKAQQDSADYKDSEPEKSSVKEYAPVEVTKGELLAAFDFEDLEAGVTTVDGGSKAIAAVKGTVAVADSYDGTKAAKLSKDFWLNVTDVDGAPLLKGMDEITISYDGKYDTTNNSGWTIFATPNAGSVNGDAPTYFGVLDRAAGLRAERYLNGRTSDVENKSNVSGWKHVDVVITRSNYTVYVDGEVWATKDCDTVQLSNILKGTGVALQVGKADWGSGEYYSGLIDNLEIYYRDTKASDDADVAAVKTAAVEALETYSVPQVEANTEAEVKEFVNAVINGLTLKGVAVEIVPSGEAVDFTAAVEGTETDTLGTDGALYYKLKLSKGMADSVLTDKLTVVIKATEYGSEITLKAPTDLKWNGKNVEFAAAKQEKLIQEYAITLYKDGAEVANSTKTIKATGASTYTCYMGDKMAGAGNYTFKVISKGAPEMENLLPSDAAESTAIAYAPAEILKGNLIASLDFEDLGDGVTEIAGTNVKATVQGTAATGTSHDGSKAAKISKEFWLNVTKADGAAILAGVDELTISYDTRSETTGNGTGWAFYTAPNTDSPKWSSGIKRYYLGINDRNNEINVERFKDAKAESFKISGLSLGWRHVDLVVTLEGIKLYVDGELKAEKATDTSYQLSDILTETGGIFQIGKGNWNPEGEYYTGLIDNFKIYARDTKAEDTAALEEAKTEVEAAIAQLTMTQAAVADETTAKAVVAEVIAALNLEGVIVEVTTAGNGFVAATAGTVDNQEGINGGFTFTVTLNKGYADSVSIVEKTIVITATAYVPSGDDNTGDGAGDSDVSGGDGAGDSDVSGGDGTGDGDDDGGSGDGGTGEGGTGDGDDAGDSDVSGGDSDGGSDDGTTEVPETPVVPETPAVPETPVVPEQPDDDSNNYEEVVVDWNAVAGSVDAEIEAVKHDTTNASGNVNIVAGTNAVVPENIVESLRGDDVTLAMHLGNETALSVSGENVPNGRWKGDINLALALSTVPADVVSQVTDGAITSRTLTFASKESMGMVVNAHFGLGEENAGKYANMYEYSESLGKYICVGTFKITENGQAMFGLTKGGDYVVTVTASAATVVGSTAYYVVQAGDTLSRIAAKYGMKMPQIKALNPDIKNPGKIYPGQRIRVQ